MTLSVAAAVGGGAAAWVVRDGTGEVVTRTEGDEAPAGGETDREADGRDGDDDGEGDADEADGEGDADDEDEDDDGEGDEEGVTEGSTGTRGMDGRTTAGCREASAGPTARTATQTTSSTRMATAKLITIRAVLKGREECFAGNGRPPCDQQNWRGRLPLTPCPWHGGPAPC
nr:hypothetical protein [uncultured Actinoplanes sp.]